MTSRAARASRFSPRDGIAHADAALALEDQGLGHRALVDREVPPRARRVEIAEGGALAAALGDRHLRHADAFLRRAVLVGIVGQADLLGGRDHHLEQRHLVARRVGDPQHAVAAAELVRAAVEAFHPLEDRQHVLVAPAAVAELRPVVVVLRLAADEDHAVDRARAAQHLAARHLDAPPARALVRLRRVAPVDRGIVDHLGDADRHARPEEARALGAGLEQQHPVGAAFRQPAGDHGARRARTDDDVVISGFASHRVLFLLATSGQRRDPSRSRRRKPWHPTPP